jgi:large subunit ribosomal protein L15
MSEFVIKPPKGAKSSKRILGRGRGSGKGKTCGKGHKGQNSRSGGKVRPGFEGGQMPLYRRVARRGFSNYPFKKIFVPINISELDKNFSNGDTISLKSLLEKKLVGKNDKLVKILGEGETKKKFTIVKLKVSKSAREKISKAGGAIETEKEEKQEQVEANGE